MPPVGHISKLLESPKASQCARERLGTTHTSNSISLVKFIVFSKVPNFSRGKLKIFAEWPQVNVYSLLLISDLVAAPLNAVMV
jgi:hypothetical protein